MMIRTRRRLLVVDNNSTSTSTGTASTSSTNNNDNRTTSTSTTQTTQLQPSSLSSVSSATPYPISNGILMNRDDDDSTSSNNDNYNNHENTIASSPTIESFQTNNANSTPSNIMNNSNDDCHGQEEVDDQNNGLWRRQRIIHQSEINTPTTTTLTENAVVPIMNAEEEEMESTSISLDRQQSTQQQQGNQPQSQLQQEQEESTTPTSNNNYNNNNNIDKNSSNREPSPQERRSSIQHILKHPNLTQEQRRHSIQILMDGRRRSSFGSTFQEAAANVVAEFSSMGGGGGGSSGHFSGNTSRRSSMSVAGCGSGGDGKPKGDKSISSSSSSSSSSTHRNNNININVDNCKMNKDESSQSQQHLMEQQQQSQNHPPTIAYTLQEGLPTGNPQFMVSQQPICTHYKRNCSIISPCCGMVFGCRLCHDECEDQYMPFMKILQEEKEKERAIEVTSGMTMMMSSMEQNNSSNVGSSTNKSGSRMMTMTDQECCIPVRQNNDCVESKTSPCTVMSKNQYDDQDVTMKDETYDGMDQQEQQQPPPTPQHQQQEDFQIYSSTTSSHPIQNTMQMNACNTNTTTTSGAFSTFSSTNERNNFNNNNDNNNQTTFNLNENNGSENDYPMTTATAGAASMTANATKRSFSRRLSLSSVVSENGGDDIHHDIDRFAIEEIICRNCFTRQSSKTNNCIKCGVKFGEYHCNICNLWMEDKDGVYHCDKCGICRVGGKENFKHCDTCGMCIDIDVFDDHNCQAGKFMAKCPVCYEDLFSSRSACHELPCNHSIHWQCFYELSRVDIRCPICKKTMFPDEDKDEIWRGLREDIETQPLPPEETRVVDLVCNDCEKRDCNRRWHPLGVECSYCHSFNTSIDIKMAGIEAFNFLQKQTNRRGQSTEMRVDFFGNEEE